MISILLLIKLDIAIAIDINIDVDQNPPHTQASDLTAAMFSVYKATGAHWSERRRLVCCIIMYVA